jgi:hypothetical protein
MNKARETRPTMMFSIISLQFFAAVGVKLAHDEKDDDHTDVNQICHASTVARFTGGEIIN